MSNSSETQVVYDQVKPQIRHVRPFKREFEINSESETFLRLLSLCDLANRIEQRGVKDKDEKMRSFGFFDWELADKLCDDLALLNPKDAFKKGIGLINIQRSPLGKIKNLFGEAAAKFNLPFAKKDLLPGWLRGIGYTILQSQNMKNHFAEILADRNLNDVFISTINHTLDWDIMSVDEQAIIDDPAYFEYARAFVVATRLVGMTDSRHKSIVGRAIMIAKSDSIFAKFKSLSEFGDTKDLYDELVITKNNLLETTKLYA